MFECDRFTLPNGITVVHKQVSHTKISHCGIMLDVGSRDEKPGQEGIAHFWEHMAFKGTQKRKSFHIISKLDSVGGELNAYTTKEKICFHASVTDNHFDKAVDLLVDITFNSIFPEKELEKEKGVILEEMSMYYDSPDDYLQDDFDSQIFNNHQLGVNIIGNETSVKSFKRENFINFINENLDTSRIVFSSVSSLPFKTVKKVVEKYFSDISSVTNQKNRNTFNTYSPQNIVKNRDFTQAYCALGNVAYSLNNPKRVPFFMLTNILGGPAMNSRLNLELREKYGFVYSVESSFHPFSDTGLFAIYFATEKKQANRCFDLVKKQLAKLRNETISSSQLKMYKEQLKGQLAIADERNSGLMLMMARSILDLGRIDSLEELFIQTDSITSTVLMELANEVFDENQLSTLMIQK
ncbi:MAG: pitrilysin family protein [Cytophagales bacterium]